MSLDTLKRLGKTLAFRLLILALILYALYHCVAAFSDRVMTDVVTAGVDRETVTGEAVLFRDETVLSVDGGNLLCSYPNPNGAKVNLTTPLCQLYTSSLSAEALAPIRNSLQALDRQIALAEQLPSSDMLSLLPSLQSALKQQVIANNRLLAAGERWQGLTEGANALLITLNRIDALTADGGSNAELLSALRAERQALLTSVGRFVRTVTGEDFGESAGSGYFFYGNTVDGYEEIFRRAELATMTIADFETLMNTPRKETPSGVTNLGKLISGFAWSIALPVSYELNDRLTVGERYEVTFPHEDNLTLSMTLDRIIPSVADGRAILVLSCSTMPSGFSYTRFSTVELTLTTTEGYRVPETSLHTRDGQDGVYILDGGRVSFRTIHILSRGEGYVLVYAPTRAERTDEEDTTYHYDRYLDIRDIVITQGEDLYDGKYIE